MPMRLALKRGFIRGLGNSTNELTLRWGLQGSELGCPLWRGASRSPWRGTAADSIAPQGRCRVSPAAPGIVNMCRAIDGVGACMRASGRAGD